MGLNSIIKPRVTLRVSSANLHVPSEVSRVFMYATGAVTIPEIYQANTPTGTMLELFNRSDSGGAVTITDTAVSSTAEGKVHSEPSGGNVVLAAQEGVVLRKRANGSWTVDRRIEVD